MMEYLSNIYQKTLTGIGAFSIIRGVDELHISMISVAAIPGLLILEVSSLLYPDLSG
jgi:hypothetical protein